MNSRPFLSDASAEDQAALWAARLDGSTLSAADRNALDAWLAENPGHRALLSDYCQLSADLETQLPALIAAGRVAAPEKMPRRRSGLKLILGGSFAMAAAAAVVVWLAMPVAPLRNLATPVATRQLLTLADGTRVELNARTQLLVLKTGAERRVRLVAGEAFFSVTKDPAHPFIVETPSGSVRVTGTQFDVRAENASSLEVIVAEGSVQVRPGEGSSPSSAEPVALTVGNRLVVSADGKVSKALLAMSDLEDALAWRQGQIVFDRTPLREALARFAWFHGRVITVTPGAAEQRLSGRYSLDSLDGFLVALQAVELPVRVAPGANGAIRVSLKNEP